MEVSEARNGLAAPQARRQYGPRPADVPAGPTISLLVCYDIADDAIRSRVSDVLSRYGPRVQLSTFECRVSNRREMRGLVAELRAAIDPACDQIRVYNFGTRPAAPEILGQRELEEWQDFLIV